MKQISKYPIIDGEFLENGYYYIERLNISYKGLCANNCKKEILNLLEHTGDTFEIKIKLSNGRIIIFKQNWFKNKKFIIFISFFWLIH